MPFDFKGRRRLIIAADVTCCVWFVDSIWVGRCSLTKVWVVIPKLKLVIMVWGPAQCRPGSVDNTEFLVKSGFKLAMSCDWI